MGQQLSFAEAEQQAKKRQTRRERFLVQMEQVVPWIELVEVIRPHYPTTGGRGCQPKKLESMLRIYCLQQ